MIDRRKECSSDVSSRSFGGALRDIQKTAARETSFHYAKRGTGELQGPEEMCLSLERQNPSKTSVKMGYFVRVTGSLHFL